MESSIDKVVETPVFDVDATRQAARQRALPCDPTLPAAKRRLDAVCAPGYTGRKRGEVVRTRTTALQMHTHQWIGTYGGKGNGDYRDELTSALRAITTALSALRFSSRSGSGPPRWTVWRRRSDCTAHSCRRVSGDTWKRLSADCASPQIQRILAHPPTASVTESLTGVIVELFEGGWLDLGAGRLKLG